MLIETMQQDHMQMQTDRRLQQSFQCPHCNMASVFQHRANLARQNLGCVKDVQYLSWTGATQQNFCCPGVMARIR